MKVNGTDPLAKLLLELNNQSFRTPASGDKVSIDNLSNQVKEIFIQRDEVILKGDSLLRLEIQFTRQHHETPEAYLQRISSEMIKMKESQNNMQDEMRQMLNPYEDTVDIALRAGLLKELVEQDKLEKGTASDATETRWLLILSLSFIALLIIYLIFNQ